MTLTEFKAWVDGFCEAIPPDTAPTAEQFAKIRAKLASVYGDTTVVPPETWPPPSQWPWPSLPPMFVPNTGSPLPDHGIVICGIDWSSDHLADMREQGRQAAA